MELSDYDRKFEEMKKYIPFLESMIKRLESTSTASSNPRQAQLDKIRSLRDLLLDKKKRMKMENLLKCEQVLVNLYAKVEQRDTLPGIKKASEPLFPSDASTETQKSDLNSARSKLMTVATKSKPPENDPDTLPEIAPACETEVVCTPGSKEPALFQRRPNKNSRSPVTKSPNREGISKKSPQKTVPKRNYTRVLVSPEPSPRRWTPSKELDQPLFSRRYRKSPKKTSPQKKDKRPSSTQSKARDLNITLNVPEESLHSLNTTDILTRIIKCPDNDVDIDTLRDLRAQILGELKQTGTNDDISDLILKSYKNKKKKSKSRRKVEVEEGELSDSESEAIQSIYGSLKVVDEDKNNFSQTATTTITSTDKDNQQRKIQICLVINDKEESANNAEVCNVPEFEIFDIEKNDSIQTTIAAEVLPQLNIQKKNIVEAITKGQQINTTPIKEKELLTIEVEDDDDLNKDCTTYIETKENDTSYIDISSDTDCQSPKTTNLEADINVSTKANFYNENKEIETDTPSLIEKPLDQSESLSVRETHQEVVKIIATPNDLCPDSNHTDVPENPPFTSEKSLSYSPVQEEDNDKQKDNVEIPLLNTESAVSAHTKQDVVSEIDILQALKNEILSDSIAIPGSNISTPLLHQPKVTKVASAHEIMVKKRISIEKYKEKSVTTTKPSLFLKDPNMITQSSENLKKSSLKLTKEEQQRFNIPLDSSDEEEYVSTPLSIEAIYEDLAPQSPENSDKVTSVPPKPIIIPVDPVKSTVAMSKVDVDMRTLTPVHSPNEPLLPTPSSNQLLPTLSSNLLESNIDKRSERQSESRRAPLLDPRIRREFSNPLGKDSPNSHTKNFERTPRHSGNFPIVTSNMTPSRTPNTRAFEMTPSRQTLDLDDNSCRKHVYAPFPTFEPRDQREQSVNRDTQGPRWEPREQSVNRDTQGPHWEPNAEPLLEERNSPRWDLRKDTTDMRDIHQEVPSRKWNDRDQRSRPSRESGADYRKPRYDVEYGNRKDAYSHENNDDYSYSRMDCPRTPVHPFGRSDCPTTPLHPFGRSECPTTPIHPFGRTDWRSEAPMTPSHSFGRSETPLTPSHPFGRSEAPMTPSHPFGRSEAPLTPSHPFGRSEAPRTPSHPFGRTDAPMTPNHQFGRPDVSLAPGTPSHPFGRSDYKHVKDPRLNRNTDYESNSRKFEDDRGGYYKDRRMSDYSRKTYNRTESYPNYSEHSIGRNHRNQFKRDRTPGREPSVGRALPRNYENDALYTRDRGGGRTKDCENELPRNYNERPSRDYHRSQSAGQPSVADERFRRSSSRGLGDTKNIQKQSNENTLSVKPQSGRSFTIDTSVNSTFQEFLNGKGLQVFDYSFDSRRQRAASVGRTLLRETSVGRNIRESSVGRTLSKPTYAPEEDTSGYKRMVNFVRARSMGRELVDSREKSFKEIKAELRSYKTVFTSKEKNKINMTEEKSYCRDNRDPRSRKELSLKHMDKRRDNCHNKKKTAYSPRKNYRDPRMHKEPRPDIRNRYEDKKNIYGIVYSSDNIAKGTILGSGYGVKNYKIPKIKKPVEEKKIEENLKIEETKNKAQSIEVISDDKHAVKKDKDILKSDQVVVKKKQTNTPKKEMEFVKKSQNDNAIIKKTRRSKIIDTKEVDDKANKKTRKIKKLVIDSDSESDTVISKQPDQEEINKTEKNMTDISETGTQEKADKNHDALTFSNSFGLDDLENIFQENLNSEPVLANIDALIADLDSSIDTTKAEDFSKDMTLTNMFESINSPEENIDQSFLSEVINNLESVTDEKQDNNLLSKEMPEVISITPNNNFTLEQSSQPAMKCTYEDETNVNISPSKKQKDHPINLSSVLENTTVMSNESIQNDQIEVNCSNNDYVVSTTNDDQKSSETIVPPIQDCASTPDSTYITSPAPQHKPYDEDLPDSTVEKNEMLSDVSSSRDRTQSITKGTETSAPVENSVTSIGSLLSILQDKSKIKELLSMLGENQTGDNEKIKKKLEKLSEIVSEDDESNEGTKNDPINKEIESSRENESDCNDSIKLKSNIEVLDKSLIEATDATNNELLDKNLSSNIESENNEVVETKKITKKQTSKVKKRKKTSTKRKKKGIPKFDNSSVPGKRVTRSKMASCLQKAPKKPSRELKLLQESIKEMFIKEDILNATGIRMCRLAKLVNENSDKKDSHQEEETNTQNIGTKPIVIIEKIKENDILEDKPEPKIRKKPGPKPKVKPQAVDSNHDPPSNNSKDSTIPKYKPGPKSKTKHFQEDSDPYTFDDSVSEATTTHTSEPENNSETEDESIASSKSCESSEVLAELKKKPKRKKRGKAWQSGIIKKKRRKNDLKQGESSLDDSAILPNKEISIPDKNCFTDKSYCFLKNIFEYPCRLCEYNGPEIVKHYKTEHPHTEIPLSRMNAVIAREAVEQCEDVNFQAISKMHTDKYVCRFCFEEFRRKMNKNTLEEFFWHVVSMHTGEYKRICSDCMNVTRCPFNLDIPPPPKDPKSQLIGYICGKCNFTQISLENLKTHVIVRHNDEQTAVYTINLAVMTKNTIQQLMKRCNSGDQVQIQRTLRSTSKPEVSEASDYSETSASSAVSASDTDSLKTTLKKNRTSPVRSKLSFENDDNVLELPKVKVESDDVDMTISDDKQCNNKQFVESLPDSHSLIEQSNLTSDVLDCPHFKISYAVSGTKEYVCCINGTDNHYKTHLLISMRRHVQVKHSEIWDGYCSVCKVIVMPQGEHRFKDCLQHLLDVHMDNFPIFEPVDPITDQNAPGVEQSATNTANPTSERTVSPPTYINVRPLTDLLATDTLTSDIDETMPKIKDVVSLGSTPIPLQKTTLDVAPSSIFKRPASFEKAAPKPEEPYKYEEMQVEVMSRKHSVILDTMLTENKLVQIFKCAGRYCSFTTDSADAALLHASTHQRIGGENALLCAYCDFESQGNAIDLVMHVFKMHGRCPYVCGHCFYRAVASQLVLAHIQRVHGMTGVVLQTDTVAPADDDATDMLPRDVAVLHYVCFDAEGTCKFKTYTQGKFTEHLLKHTAPYTCYNCSLKLDHASDLIQHMKTHGLKLYQCTWCIEGGDNEGDFLAHSSARHPTRQPQAYLRIITNNNKAGEARTMVLPLAKLNKSSVPTRLVKPQISANDPAREAEKSLDMEKLIAAMPTISSEIENRPVTPTNQLPLRVPIGLSPPPLIPIEKDTPPQANVLEQPSLVTPSQLNSAQEEDDSLTSTPILKKETIDVNYEKNDTSAAVICLDSDEDEDSGKSGQPEKDTGNIIELSDDDRTLNSDAEKNKRFGPLELFKCKNCKVTFKSLAGFKRHVSTCFLNENFYSCAHCVFSTDNLEEFSNHYNLVHGTKNSQKPFYSCKMCPRLEKSLWLIKSHLKKDHGITNVSVARCDDGNFIVSEASPKVKAGPKRKLSGDPVQENLPKRIRYGAQDLHKLPQKPILDELAYCFDCEFSTKVRLNLVRHIQQHADNQLVPQTAPVNPVPHLETNEKHFDKMINLASSSFELGRSEKSTPTVTLHIPPEAASRYPKYVSDRQRYTCGAKDCSYTSVDEAMLKIHWETLHASSYDFHCVHCPPNQYLDTSKPLTAPRIIAHLKMHDIRLYACSSCTYYHYRKQVVEKHLSEVHKGSGQVMVVREESTNLTPAGSPQVTGAAPTMDLKPWKCGLCSFKSMLRPEVIEHCSKIHNTKMQFKCPVCPFRTSTIENVAKHKTNSHPESKEDIFFFYYREGSIPDEPDGTPRWVKQRQSMGNLEPDVKTETPESIRQNILLAPLPQVPPVSAGYNINLDIVKEEIMDSNIEEPMEALCKRFGEICDPNGLKYKCPLCFSVTEENRETMRSHLYEELQYRKWACSICCYKAFHKLGLKEHFSTEHIQTRTIEPIELDADTRIERWVNKVLDHQTAVIESSKVNLEKQKIQVEKTTTPSKTKLVENSQQTVSHVDDENDAARLTNAFGPLGAPNGSNFVCPKCPYETQNESAMKDHLETELNKIRWRCSGCSKNSQNYHEAQLHSKTCSGARGGASRPVEAPRDPGLRAAWVAAVVRAQGRHVTRAPQPPPHDLGPDNSLLAVLYEERVPTPEVEMMKRKRPLPPPAPQPPSPPHDSDDERLVIDELSTDEDSPKKHDVPTKKCSYCPYATKYMQALEFHVLRHYNLKPMTCCYCEDTLCYSNMESHYQKFHPNLPKKHKKTIVPSGPPPVLELSNKRTKRSSSSVEEVPRTTQKREEVRKEDGSKLICLICEKSFTDAEATSHAHDKPTYFASKGDVVVKCCVCLSLFPNLNLVHEHNIQSHPNTALNYAYFKLNHDNREILQCGHCTKRFKFARDLKIHHNVVHRTLQLKYESRPYNPDTYHFEYETDPSKTSDNALVSQELSSQPVQAAKRVAKKSTTKLPRHNNVAKKSTTKSPFYVDSDSESEFSYYGEKPSPLDCYQNVTMPIFDNRIPLEKFGQLTKINPVILIKDCKK